MNAKFAASANAQHHKQFPMSKVASLALALALLGTLAGCGKSAAPTAPVTSSSSGPSTQTEAKQVAQQSAAVANTYLERTRFLLTTVHVPGARPATERPFTNLSTASDSASFTYALQGFDIGGNPINWITQGAQLASLAMDFRLYRNVNRDSLLSEYDQRSHSNVAGLNAAATRFVANATDTAFMAYNGYTAGNHVIFSYASTSNVTSLAWEKSGTPTYPVAGSFTLHCHWVSEYWYGTQHGSQNFDTDVTITFDGTRYASVLVGTYSFTLDLETGAVS